MLRNTGRRARRTLVGSAAVAVALAVSAAAATGSGASVAAQKQKIDKTAVLPVALNTIEQGGLNFDPNNATLNPIARNVWDLIYDTMIIWDPKTDELKPGLATKWEISPDQKTITLTLRDGVKFTDGAPFTAAAVKAAWDKQVKCGRTMPASCSSTPVEIKDAFASVEAPNDKTVKITLNQPIAKTVVHDQLTNSRWLAVPSPNALDSPTLNQNPVGAGPYKLKSFPPGGILELEQNPNYWDPKSQKLAGYKIYPLVPGQPSMSAMQTGTVDVMWNFTPDIINAVKAINGVKLIAEPGVRINDLGLCVSKGIFANKAARQAMQYAVDRNAINEAVLAGTGQPTSTVVPASYPLFDAEYAASKLKQYDYNPKKAAKLLREAGVPEGTKVTVMTSTNPGQPQQADIVAAQLKDVGLAPEVTVTNSLTTEAPRLLPDIVLAGIDPNFWSIAFERTTTLNHCGYSSPAVSAALQVLKDGSKTPAEQKAALKQFQDTVLDDSPFIFTATGPLLGAQTKRVGGWDGIIWPSGPVLRTLYVKK